MHAPSVENPPPASTEAAGSSNYLDTLFGPDTDDAPAPELICEVVSQIAELSGAAPQAVAAVVLAALGAAIGPNVVLTCGRQRCTLGINVVVAHGCPLSLPWMDAITAPFIGRVFEMQADVVRLGLSGIEERDKRRSQAFTQARGTVHPKAELISRLETELGQSQARLKPFVAASGFAPKELAGLLPRAFDNGVTVVAAGNDPGVDLLRMKSAERAQLSQLLNRSWAGTPLTFGDTVLPGSVSLLWSTRKGIKQFIGSAGFDTAALPVPILVFADESSAAPLPQFACEPLWDKQVGHLFERRCLGQPTAYTLHGDAEAVLSEFSKHLAGMLNAVPAALRAHVGWLPELAARVTMIYWVVAGHDALVIDAEMTTAAVEMTKWLGRQHVAAMAVAVPADNADLTDNQAKMLAKIRAKAPITRRDLRRTFENQKVQWFDAALDALLEAKKVRYNAEVLLVPYA